jgi:3-hydroxyisobutyrate dehydrogenase-like beta-hydroxyacid dehydrogenase
MTEQIGFIGLGKMGLPMAKNLLKNGYTVYGTDVNDEAISEFQSLGGIPGKLEDWTGVVNAIILMLPSSAIVNRVLEDLLAAIHSRYSAHPLMVIDMGSSYPEDTRKNSLKLKRHQISLVDAPVSGGVGKAIDGTLTIMAGGDYEDFKNCKRLLIAMGTNIYHVGPSGSGHLIKAINNYLSATHLLATCEAVQLLEKYGVEPAQAIHVFNQSTGRSGSTEYKFPSFILNQAYNSGFSLELLKKDVGMASQLFKDTEAATSLPEVVFEKYQEAACALDKDADHTEINKFVTSYLLKRGNINEENEKMASGSSDIGSNAYTGSLRKF